MKLLYKLTDNNGQTRDQTQWGPGVTHKATGKGKELCSDGWIHAYEHPLLAVLHNPIHGNYTPPRLWLAKGGRKIRREGQMKIGVKSLTTIEELPLPEISTEQRVRYAILCAKAVYDDPAWTRWADAWLDGSERSEKAAWAAYQAVEQPAWAAYKAVEQPALAAYKAVEQPAWAAYQAVRQPALAAYEAVRQPALAAYEAVREPAWAAYEAERAVCAAERIDLIALAEQAVA